ncbi:unnamed protein product, partial [Candidula unifasciata]
MTIKKKIQTKYRLPILNWTPLKPQQLKGTIFSDLDDEKLYTVIDFSEFEDIFRLGPAGALMAGGDGTPKMLKKNKKQESVSLLEPNRLRNVAITRRKIELTNDDIVKAINGLDIKKLSLDIVDIMLTILPNDQEMKAYKIFERDRRPVSVLSDEDKFMLQMVKVERLTPKLQIMSFIGNFYDNIHQLQPQVNAVIAASMSLKNSHKVRKIMEIILALGNYMNSNKRGAVYGFKLQSLDMLVDTKSGDKKTTLMHFLAMTVHDKFPDLLNFDSELRFLDKAAVVSMENISTDIHELERGMELTKRESQLRKDSRDYPLILKDFLANADDKFKKLLGDVKTAQDSYKKVVEFYGENPRSISPAQFFSQIVRFVNSFKQALLDNERRRKLEHGLMEPEVQPIKKKDKKMTQSSAVSEYFSLSAVSDVKEKRRLLNTNEPYRRADALRKSQRRRAEIIIQSQQSGSGGEVF